MILRLLKCKKRYTGEPPGDSSEFFYTDQDIRIMETVDSFIDAMAGMGFTAAQVEAAMISIFSAMPSVNDIVLRTRD